MKAIKTRPKFKCDFCKRKNVKHIMEKHEPSCYLNPKRMCQSCNNTGKTYEDFDNSYGGLTQVQMDCRYCAKYNEIQLEIKENSIEYYSHPEESLIF